MRQLKVKKLSWKREIQIGLLSLGISNMTEVVIVPANDVVLTLEKLELALKGEITVFISEREINGVQPEIIDLPAEATDTALIIESSGSTGSPKKIYLSKEALIASAEATKLTIGEGQWLLALPINYIAGAMVLVRSILAGTKPVVMNTGVSFTPEAFSRSALLLSAEDTFVSLVPTQLKRIREACLEDSFLLSQMKRFKAVLVGGQSIAPELLEYFRTEGVNVLTTYGMAETAGGCVYGGGALAGVDIKINPDGTISIAGPMLANGVSDESGFLNTQDQGEFFDGFLRVLGRVDRVLISGGLKVGLDQVEAVAGAIPGVVEVVATALDSSEWGERVGMVYVGSPEVADYMAAAVFEQLGLAAKPVRVIRVDRLPRLVSGKPDLVSVRKLFDA
jgi:O-succinylbenzoic acid--CoA ligase